MAIEIEHKYLVKTEPWKKIVPHQSVTIKQAYLLTDPDKTIRIRTKGEQGFLTIKGKAVGSARLEFEYEIPIAEANELIRHFSSGIIVKTRHLVVDNGHTWEVDEFRDQNEGLMVAEIELTNESEYYSVPEWVGENVTADRRYANSNLSLHPFTTW